MFFADLRSALLECLRTRVKNGQSTERGLARVIGISQPHMHNVLKGTRALSVELSDQILHHLRLSLLDLVDRDRLIRHVESEPAELGDQLYLPVLQGRLGPGHPWPFGVEAHERFHLPAGTVSRMFHPVIVRLAEDSRMDPLFTEGDLALLDQGQRVRTEIDPQGYYVIKRGRTGLVRRLRFLGRTLYMVSNDVLDKPAAWERLPIEDHPITYFVRARAKFVPKVTDWS